MSAFDETDESDPRAPLVVSLDTILFELSKMEGVVRDAEPSSFTEPDRRKLRADIEALLQRADSMMTWLYGLDALSN